MNTRNMSLDDVTEDIVKEIRLAHEVNIIVGSDILESDLDLFLGPLRKKDICIFVDEKTSFPQAMKMLGVFKSASQARKSGWDGRIPFGFSEFERVSKFRIHICFLFLPDSGF